MDDKNFTPNVDALKERNAHYASTSHASEIDVRPALHLAVVACMDARIDVHAVLGISNGDAHIIRNAGGVITDDVIRSLCLSQRELGTREIVLVHHTRCGLHNVDEGAFRAELSDEVGAVPSWSLQSFGDPYEDVQQSIDVLRNSPFVPHTDHVSGFVFDVDTGVLEPVDERDG